MNTKKSTESQKNINSSNKNHNKLLKEKKLFSYNINDSNKNKLFILKHKISHSSISLEENSKIINKDINNLSQLTPYSTSKLTFLSKSNRVIGSNNLCLDIVQKNNKYQNEKEKENIEDINYEISKYTKKKRKSQKPVLNLNKRIKRERNLKKNMTNYDFKNIDFINENTLNKFNKNLKYNYSHESIHENKDFNNSNIPHNFKIKQKRNKNNLIFNQYYADIDLSSNNNSNNSKIIKKEFYLTNPSKNEYIINTYIYNSPLDQQNILNNRKIISSNDSYTSIIQKNKIVNEDKNSILLTPKIKKNEKKSENKEKKVLPFDKMKLIPLNKSHYKNTSIRKQPNIDSIMRNESNNVRIKKDIYYILNPSIYNDDMSFQKDKKNARTAKLTLEKNNSRINTEQIQINLNKITKNNFKEIKNNRIRNQKIILSDHVKFGTSNYFEGLDNDEFNELKSTEKKELKYKSSHISGKRQKSLSGYSNSQDNMSSRNYQQRKIEYICDDNKSLCLIDSRGNLNNINYKILKFKINI